MVTGGERACSRLLLLADSRLPSGAHAHSGGVEQAISQGLVGDLDSLAWFTRRRLSTGGLLAAAAAAQANRCAADEAQLAQLDRAVDVRTPSPALRAASRNQGRGLLRLARRTVPDLPDLGRRPHHSVVLGVLAAVLGIGPAPAAAVAAQGCATGITAAAQRLLALDPFDVAGLLLDLSDAIGAVAAAGAAAVELPDTGDPLADLLAEIHAMRKDRYFVS